MRVQRVIEENVSPPALRKAQARRALVLLTFYFYYISLVISVRPIISTSTGPIFTGLLVLLLHAVG